jgi:hypothetical protein
MLSKQKMDADSAGMKLIASNTLEFKVPFDSATGLASLGQLLQLDPGFAS